jgi:hypothetical protein
MGREKGLFQLNGFIGSIKLHKIMVKESNLSQDTHIRIQGGIKGQDHRKRQKGLSNAYFKATDEP